jgi:hypothetical protein
MSPGQALDLDHSDPAAKRAASRPAIREATTQQWRAFVVQCRPAL